MSIKVISKRVFRIERKEKLLPLLRELRKHAKKQKGFISRATFSNDNLQSRDMKPYGSHVRVKPEKDRFDAHLVFMTNPSLSGRGSALHPRKIKDQRKKI